MTPYSEVLQDKSGNVLPATRVRVTISGSNTPAPIYYDAAGTQPITDSIVTADIFGTIQFWSPGGTLKLALADAGRTLREVFIASAPVSYLQTSRVSLAGVALAGGIPSSTPSLFCGCYATPGDGGAALYRRVSAAAFAAYGLLPATVPYVSFPDASGDVWLLDTDTPKLAMVGCMGQLLGLIPDTSMAADCSPYINALNDMITKIHVVGLIEHDLANYYIHQSVTFPPQVGISCAYTGRDTRANDGLDAIGGINFMPGLVINPTASLLIDDGFYSRQLTIKRAGIVIHTDLAGALDMQLSFAGIGITKRTGGKSARNVTIERFVAFGFAFGADFYKTPGLRIGDAFGDCNTLIMLRKSGETGYIDHCKRKPILTNNTAIDSHSIRVRSLYNAGGLVGLEMDEDVIVLGLTTGQRVGNQKLPDPFVSIRRTVQVVDATHVVLEDEPWNSSYASFLLKEGSTISWQVGCASGVTSFYNASGKVGVNTRIALPFQTGHFALVGCGELPQRGFFKVLTRNSATNFVIDVVWNPALLSVPAKDAELAAMPNNRRHSTVVEYWGSTEGFGAALVDSDGSRIRMANKGGGGLYCSSGSTVIEGSNEGGSIGELDLNDVDTTGLEVTQPRTVFTGAWKSCGVALRVNTESSSDMVYGYGLQLTDNGRASIHMVRGEAILSGVAVKGLGRVLLEGTNPDELSLDVLHGELTPENVIGDAQVKKKVALRWRKNEVVHQVAGAWSLYCWNDSGTATKVMDATKDGVTFLGATAVNATPKALTATGSPLTLAATDHTADVLIQSNGATILLDANAVPNGFMFRLKNYRPGGDWIIPQTAGYWGTGVIVRFALNAVHTKLLAGGHAECTVRDISGFRYLLIDGHTAP